MKGYGKFLDGIEKIEKLFLAVTVAIMIIVITYQVILRYVFSASNAWSEELARYLFIYDVMVAAAIATRRNSHLQVDAFIGILKPRTKAIYTVIATIVGIVFLVFLFCYSVVLCQAAAVNVSAGLKIPMSVPYAFNRNLVFPFQIGDHLGRSVYLNRCDSLCRCNRKVL